MVLLTILFLNLGLLNPAVNSDSDLLAQHIIPTKIKYLSNTGSFVKQETPIIRLNSQLSTQDEITKRVKQQRSWIWWISFIGHPFTQWILITILALTAIWRHQIRRRKTRKRWEQEEETERYALEKTRRQYKIH